MKLKAEFKEAVRAFVLASLEQVFEGVEAQQPTEQVVALDFHAMNDVVDLNATLTLPLFWE